MEKINWADYKSDSSPIMNVYRVIGANLQNTMVEKKAKMLVFTSLTASAKKSSVVAGIAITLAQTGKKVMLIDSNFIEPVQHILFGVSNEGILECASSDTDYWSVIQHCTEQPDLDILASGKVQRSVENVMLSNAMQQFLRGARDQYDYILLDVPSLENTVDAIVISPKTDGVIMIVTKGEDTVNALADAKSQLEQAGAIVLGCVLISAMNADA